MSEDIKAAFYNLPKSKFPVRMLMISPEQEIVWDSGEIEGASAIPIPGFGAGSVRYSIHIYGDGEVQFADDPTCAGTIKEWSAAEISGKIESFLTIAQEAAREAIEKGSKLAGMESRETPIGILLHDYFETQVSLNEKILEAVAFTRDLLDFPDRDGRAKFDSPSKKSSMDDMLMGKQHDSAD